MPLLMLKELPRYECLLEAAQHFPDLDPSATEVFLQLLRTGDELFNAESVYLGKQNISQGRFTVLMLLARREGGACEEHRSTGNPAELAGKAGVTRATMTGLIDTLEKDGFVKREPDPSDRRMMTVSLTPKAEAFMGGILPGYFRRVAAVMSELSEVERKTFVALLTKIQRGIAALPPEADTPTAAAVLPA